MGLLWAVFTVLAAGGQTMRNAMQRGLTQTLGTAGATHVRFLYGLPFGLLFFAIVMLATGHPMPVPTSHWFGWVLVGALTQIVATAMLLFAMKERSFVLITALSKTEPVHVAIFGLVFLADRLTWGLALAIGLATAGVTIMSWPKDGASADLSLRPILVGLASGAVFGMSAVGFRGAVRALGLDNFVVAASTTLAAGLLVQVLVLSAYLLIREPQTLRALAAAWRPSVKAGFMGAFASQMWFLAFALESAAKVRTLALVEIFFAQIISRTLFKQSLASREGLGILCIVIGVILLLNL